MSGSSAGGAGGTTSCGCNGKSGCAVWDKVLMTITAAASDTADPGHKYEASGVVTLSPGTIIYNPEVKKYFIMEDSCLECGDEYACKLSADDTDDPKPPAGCVKDTYLHIDFWMGPSFAQDSADLETCEDDSTIGDTYAGTGSVIVNPPDNLPVVTTTLYTGTGTNGSCWTKSEVGSSTCQ